MQRHPQRGGSDGERAGKPVQRNERCLPGRPRRRSRGERWKERESGSAAEKGLQPRAVAGVEGLSIATSWPSEKGSFAYPARQQLIKQSRPVRAEDSIQ